MRGIIGFCVSICLLIGLAFAGCGGSTANLSQPTILPADEILLAGSGTNLPLTGLLIQEYNKRNNKKIKMPNSIGTNGAVRATSEGGIHLGLTSRPLKDSEKKLGLKEIPYARLGIVLGVNKDVPDTGITTQDLLDIFSGQKNKWQNGQMIVVLAREKGDSSNGYLEKEVPGFKQVMEDALAKNRWQVMFSDSEEAQAIAKTPDSFGLTDTTVIQAGKLPIKPLKVDGIDPTTDNVANGKYKLYKDLFFIYRDSIPGDVQAFLDFVYSDEGQKIILQGGGIPLKGK